jgi:hypothetical protein
MRIRRRLRKILSSIVITPVNVTESLQPIFGTALNNVGDLYNDYTNNSSSNISIPEHSLLKIKLTGITSATSITLNF